MIGCNLYGFGDVSKKVYCVMVYFVYRVEDGKIYVILIVSKIRVVFVKVFLILCLELMVVRIFV